jgi:hypothetical protein
MPAIAINASPRTRRLRANHRDICCGWAASTLYSLINRLIKGYRAAINLTFGKFDVPQNLQPIIGVEI